MMSIKIAEKKRADAIAAFHRLQEAVTESKDDVFLRDALDLVVESRRAITMTYALAYYMEMSTNKKAILEMNQGELWLYLDQLDELTDVFRDVEHMKKELVEEIRESNSTHTTPEAYHLLYSDDHTQLYLATNFLKYKGELISKTSFLTSIANNILLHAEKGT